MTVRAGRRGQPLLLFGAILGAWLALRIAMWESPFAPRLEPFATIPSLAVAPPARSVRKAGAIAAAVNKAVSGASEDALNSPRVNLLWAASPSAVETNPSLAGSAKSQEEPRAAAGQSLVLAAGVSRIQVSPALLAFLQGAVRQPLAASATPTVPAGEPRRQLPARISRWSADGWLLLRRDGARDLRAPVLSDRPSYGRSQMGAVVRYDLQPGSPVRPRVYMRGGTALSGPRERELAGGLSARLLPGVPLRTMVEARASETQAGTRFRPAAYAVSEFPPLALPLGGRGEAYVQGGYVGGDFATAFVDGQVRAERPLARFDEGELSAGAGAWGGVQKGSARLDVGPTAAVTFRIGDARARLAADYRFRIAGGAKPGSGPALTVSAGF